MHSLMGKEETPVDSTMEVYLANYCFNEWTSIALPVVTCSPPLKLKTLNPGHDRLPSWVRAHHSNPSSKQKESLAMRRSIATDPLMVPCWTVTGEKISNWPGCFTIYGEKVIWEKMNVLYKQPKCSYHNHCWFTASSQTSLLILLL